ncbi:unnamed protein product [Malus baccata var. baccata]
MTGMESSGEKGEERSSGAGKIEEFYKFRQIYAFYETSFHDLTVKLVCRYYKIAYVKNRKKQTFRYYVTKQKISTVINENSQFNCYFSFDFNDFLQLHSSTL